VREAQVSARGGWGACSAITALAAMLQVVVSKRQRLERSRDLRAGAYGLLVAIILLVGTAIWGRVQIKEAEKNCLAVLHGALVRGSAEGFSQARSCFERIASAERFWESRARFRARFSQVEGERSRRAAADRLPGEDSRSSAQGDRMDLPRWPQEFEPGIEWLRATKYARAALTFGSMAEQGGPASQLARRFARLSLELGGL